MSWLTESESSGLVFSPRTRTEAIFFFMNEASEIVSDKWRLRSAGSGSKLGSIWKVSSPALGAGVSGWPVPYGVWENKKATVAATQ